MMKDSSTPFGHGRKISAVPRGFKFSPDFSSLDSRFSQYRKNAWRSFLESTNSSDKKERKRKDLPGLDLENMILSEEVADRELMVYEGLRRPLSEEDQGGQILLSSSGNEIILDQDVERQGVIFTDFYHAEKDHPEIFERILENFPLTVKDKFALLSAALGTNGILVYVPKNIKVDKPLHTLVWEQGGGGVFASHIFVYLEENSSVTYVQENFSSIQTGNHSVYSGLIEIYVGPEAKLKFIELQSFGENLWNYSHEIVNVDRKAEIEWIFGSLGSHVTKNISVLNLIGQSSTAKVSGFYFSDGNQYFDHDTQQNHLAPETTSDFLFKGALLDKSESVWHGMIYVAPSAVKSDGYQANRNLLLSENSRVDSIPGLEILTDDVRCTHGATVGKVDSDQIFYLQSRGIPRKTAEKIIVEGFFEPIMQRIPFKGVRDYFTKAIQEKLKNYE